MEEISYYQLSIRRLLLVALTYDLMQVVIQQLPEWKSHEWKYEEIDPSEPI